MDTRCPSVGQRGRKILNPNATGSRKKSHSLMFDDSQWSLLQGRARSAGMSVSQFLWERAGEPEHASTEGEDLPKALWRQTVVDLRALSLAERLRFEQAGAGDTWRRLVEEAEASVAADEAIG